MIRLCVDARMFSSSGIGTCIRHLIPYVSRPPFDTTFLVDRHAVFPGKKIPFQAPIYSLSEQAQFPWKIPPCDLFWSPHYNVPLLPIKSRIRVVTIHDMCHLAMPFSRGKKMVAKQLLRYAYKKSEKVITDSQFSRMEIQKYLGNSSGKIDVIYPGVDLEEFSPLQEIEAFKNKHNLGDQIFLFVGNFKAHKNLEILLKAFELLHRSSLQLVLVGKKGDPKISYLIQNSRCKERIILLGEVSQEDLPLLYASASAFIFPSLYEGFGLPPLEAMACGCPVIASQAASIPEVCRDAALYFSPHSEIELAEQMERIIDDRSLRDELIAKGLDRCREFSWEKTGTAYRTLFERLCTG